MAPPAIEKNIVYLLGASCLTNISLFLVNIILINHLPKAEFGIFTLLVSIVYIFIIFSELGVSQGTIKYISEHHGIGNTAYIRVHIRNFFSATVIISILFLLFFYISLPLWRIFYDYLPVRYAALLAPIILPYPIIRYWNAITDGFQNMKYAFLFSVVREPIKLVLLLIATYLFSLDIKSAVLVFVVSSYITLFGSYIIYRIFISRRDMPFEMEIDRGILFDKEKLRYFSYLYVSFLIFWIQPNVLYLIIGRFLNPEGVAAFTACFILNNTMWVFLLPVMDTLFPFISSVYRDRDVFERSRGKIYSVLFATITSAFMWVVIVYFLGERVIGFFYGDAYTIHKNIFYLLSISLFFDSLRVLFDPMLKGTRHANVLLYLELARITGIILIGPLSLIYGGLTYLCYLLAALSLMINLIKGFVLKRLFSVNLLWGYIYAFFLFFILFFL
ncbi:MAG: oligosaccharide flippase family protein [Syntrophorhabdaceae bacterium]|nr:oligosaccharide flippase family protein [Syntrophorhabdales bacterium]MBP9561612.1 oligosaccharide flippase family protein [Syntrophorhabdaceae bacterium]